MQALHGISPYAGGKMARRSPTPLRGGPEQAERGIARKEDLLLNQWQTPREAREVGRDRPKRGPRGWDMRWFRLATCTHTSEDVASSESEMPCFLRQLRGATLPPRVIRRHRVRAAANCAKQCSGGSPSEQTGLTSCERL